VSLLRTSQPAAAFASSMVWAETASSVVSATARGVMPLVEAGAAMATAAKMVVKMVEACILIGERGLLWCGKKYGL